MKAKSFIQVIALKDETRLTIFAINSFKYVNNSNYDPKLERQAGSLKVSVQEGYINFDSLYAFLHNIKQGSFDVGKYFAQETYKKLVDSFGELAKIRALEQVSIGKEKLLTFNKEEIIDFVKNKERGIASKSFISVLRKKDLRAFDAKKYKFVWDGPEQNKSFYIHVNQNIKLFEELSNIDDQASMKAEGSFKSTKTIELH